MSEAKRNSFPPGSEEASEATKALFRNMMAMFDGVAGNDVNDAITNAMARVAHVQHESAGLASALRHVDAMAADAKRFLVMNWGRGNG